MLRTHLKKAVVIAACFFLPYSVFAWGMQGHRIVAQIADSYLTPKAKAEILKILGDNRLLAIESNWPDFVKSDTAYNYLSSWHYVNLEPGMSQADVLNYFKNDSTTDAYTKLNFMIKELKKPNLPQDKKLMYLRLVVHIIGDIHQPMHVGHTSDLGGNKIKVSWFNEPSNLHKVWDENLIDYQQLSYTEYANVITRGVTAQQRKEWSSQSLAQWMYETYAISEKLYTEIKPDQKLSYRYNFDHVATLNQQLLKGGVRLAQVLNSIFG